MMIDIDPADPIEGMLVSQLVVAHEAALSMYQRAWAQPPDYFEARTRYLQLADKAQRTCGLAYGAAGSPSWPRPTADHRQARHRQRRPGDRRQCRAPPGGGPELQSRDQPHALAYAPGITLPSQDQARELVPIAGDEKRPVPNARRKITGRPKGK
jgi:hypothetical protein